MKQLFVIYGKVPMNKFALFNSSIGTFCSQLDDKEQGTYILDFSWDRFAEDNINKIIEYFNKGIKHLKNEETVFIKIRNIIIVGNRNLNEDEVIKIRNEVNDNIIISSFEGMKFIKEDKELEDNES